MKNAMASPISGTIVVVAVYMLARGVIYLLLPADTLHDWFVRDVIMTVPRLGAFGWVLFLNRDWKSAVFDWQPKDFGRACWFGGGLVALWALHFAGRSGPRVPWMVFAGEPFATVPVVLFEEYAFRGPLLTALSKRFTPPTGILLASGIFTLFHFQAQPFSSWGSIFLTGVILANLRLRRLSLGSLAVIHFMVDSIWLFCKTGETAMSDFRGMSVQIALLTYAVATFPCRLGNSHHEEVGGSQRLPH